MPFFNKSKSLVLLSVLLGCNLNAELRSIDNTVLENIETGAVIALWPEGTEGIDANIPEEIEPRGDRYLNIHNPNIEVFKPEQPNGVAIILCSGGGYRYVASGVEGVPTAEKLNKSGITVFVLKYRLPPTFKHPVPLSDALRAIQLVRYHAADFDIDPNKIGIMGFSAGGHLAGTAGTLYSDYTFGTDSISKVSSRPDFMCLVYSAISIGNSSSHTLLDDNPDKQSLEELSIELNVTEKTPPTFLVHTKDDQTVNYQHSIIMHDALEKHGVPSSLNLYEEGGHGFGVGRESTDSMKWSGDFVAWLNHMKFISMPHSAH